MKPGDPCEEFSEFHCQCLYLFEMKAARAQ
jgi:hypothetical protein